MVKNEDEAAKTAGLVDRLQLSVPEYFKTLWEDGQRQQLFVIIFLVKSKAQGVSQLDRNAQKKRFRAQSRDPDMNKKIMMM